MTFYKEVIMGLKDINQVREFYRFQGANSFDHFDFRTSNFNKTNGYIYFSSSLDHHKYFTIKRIRQFLNRIVLKDSPYLISCHDLRDNPDNYEIIKKIVTNSNQLSDMYSIRLICNEEISKIISDNCQYQREKEGNMTIERVDRRVYGGGYGLANEWKELLTYLTYFNSYKKIDRRAILELLANMSATGKVNNKNNINFLLDDFSQYKIDINPNLESDFTKYKIRDCLEYILEHNLCLSSSKLKTNPSETITEIVSSYEKGKRKTLSLLDKHL